MGSDHLPVIMKISLGVQVLKGPKRESKWNLKDADWESFRVEVESSLASTREALSGASLDRRLSTLVECIKGSARHHIDRVRPKPSNKVWMNREVREAIRKRNSLFRRVGSCRAEWVESCGVVNNLIRESKEKMWKDFVESLDFQSDSSRVWRVIRSLSDVRAGAPRNQVLVRSGKEVRGDRKKADAFMQHYAAVNRIEMGKEDRLFNRKVRQRMNSCYGPETELQEKSSAPFIMSELERALSETRARGAAGPDAIPPLMLKKLGPMARDWLLSCYNQSFSSGYCPQIWRNAHIIPILKGGKPASEVESYRPVSLTSCVAKVMERMVANRVRYLAESCHWFSDYQAGFRQTRSTEDQVLRLVQSISDGFQQRPKAERTVLSLLDFSKAYDRVWREDLFDTLLLKGVSTRIVRWISGFLTNRQARVRLNGVCGKQFLLRQGLPQGSVLSPLLFLFFIDSLSSCVPKEVELSLYADDVAVSSRSPSLERAQAAVGAAVDAIHLWSLKKKQTLNARKCEVSFFSTNVKEAGWTPSVHLNGVPLTFNPTPTFLGVKLDRSLCFAAHIEKVAAAVGARCRILGALAGRSWGQSQSVMRCTYLSLVHSVMSYCGAAWQPWLTCTSIGKLDAVQNRALRIVTGQLTDTPLDCLRAEAMVSSFSTVVRRSTLIAYERSLRLPESNPRLALAQLSVNHRLRVRSSWRRSALEWAPLLGLGDDVCRIPFPLCSTPPWQCVRGNHWSVSLTLSNGSTKESPAGVLLQDALNTISAYGLPEVVIYTDGSAVEGTSLGGFAAVCTTGPASAPLRVWSGARKGGLHTSSFEMEAKALGLAVDYVGSRELVGQVLICSDSKSVLSALVGTKPSLHQELISLRTRLDDLQACVSFQWIPGHCGIPGNEMADQLANSVSGGDCSGRPSDMTYSSALALIRRKVKDPAPSHRLARQVYGCGRRRSGLPRHVEVLLAQLRSGHCRKLRAYRAIVDPSCDPICPRCREPDGSGVGEPETLEHWLQECPALNSARLRAFGTVCPNLSVLCSDPVAAASFARGTLLS